MADAPCVIGKDIQIRGSLSGSGELVIEGRVEGRIQLNDHLSIEQSGSVIGDADVRELVVNGVVNGNAHASGRVEISATGVFAGDIVAPQVVIEDGARFTGRIDMGLKIESGK